MNNEELWERVRALLDARQEVGRAYGPKFVGDPLDQLIEELADALFYAVAMKAQRESGAVQPGAPRVPAEDRCGCICGCRYRGGDEFGMCGNCVRWWMRQSERGVTTFTHSQAFTEDEL
jgi:hypothetical protein